jgi:N-acetylneuraminate synthase
MELCEKSLIAWKSLGNADYKRSQSEIDNKKFRRSIYFMKDIKAGETIKADHIRIIRPGFGIEPKYLDEVIGRTLKLDALKHDPLKWEYIK